MRLPPPELAQGICITDRAPASLWTSMAPTRRFRALRICATECKERDLCREWAIAHYPLTNEPVVVGG